MTTATYQPRVKGIRRCVVVDEDPETSYLDQEEFADRKQQYRDGYFAFVGVYLEAIIEWRTPQGYMASQDIISSGGLWGIEDDSGDAYLDEVALEELDELIEKLQAINADNIDEAVATFKEELS